MLISGPGPRAGVLVVLVAGCGGVDHVEGVAAATASATVTATPVASVSSAPAPTAVSPSASGVASEGAPGACPSDMVLVEGDYCRNLEVQCEKSYAAPQNHLTVCLKVREPTVCRGDTKRLRFCIDKYEFPNREGERPMVMQNFYQAQVHCQKRGKRVCTEEEWTKACEGPNNKPFPYGYEKDPAICNGEKPWDHPDRDKILNSDPAELERLWQGKVSGSQPKCVSDYGVYDMPGNADELAASVTKLPPKTIGKKTKMFGQDFDNVTIGGPWYTGVRNMCQPKIYTHDESFAYYYLSFRCCAEPDGKPTDPRAPKQIERGWTFQRVVDLANHSWKLPYNPKGDPSEPKR